MGGNANWDMRGQKKSFIGMIMKQKCNKEQ